MRFIPFLLFWLCFETTTAMAIGEKDSLVNIPFGKNNVIRYHLNSGTWDVLFNGKPVITGAYAAYKGEKEFTSKDLGRGKYASNMSAADVKYKWRGIEWEHDGMHIRQEFYTAQGVNYFFTGLIVTGQHITTAYSSPLTAARVVMNSTGDNRALAVPFDNDMWARFNAPPFQQADFTSSEVTALYDNDNYHGLVIGSIKHDIWKTGITVKASDSHVATVTAFGGLADNNITHDKIPHGRIVQNYGTQSTSPWIIVGLYDDWRRGMEEYAAVNQESNPQVIAKWRNATPVGWNSWGALQTKLTLDKAKGVVDFFSDSCKRFRTADSSLFIDLDSFWDNLIKGGLDGDVSQLKEFVAYCKSKGFKPGIYWAPFTDWGKFDRKMEGSSYNYAQAWTRQNSQPVDMDGALALDPTHPGTKARIEWCLNHFKKLGFEMIKIDFLGHGALESDHFYDPAVTTGMQAYNMAMKFIDSVLDNTMLVYAAISPTMATAPYVHMRRIACDAFSAIDNTEYTLNSTGYGWWESHLYNFVDADHVVFNKESEGANRARLASALVTGTLVTGDDYSSTGPWSQAAMRLLQNKSLQEVIKDGRSFRPVDANTGNKGVNVFVKTVGAKTYLAVFNYSNNPFKYTLPLTRVELSQSTKFSVTELFSGSHAKWSGTVELTVSPSDAMLYLINKKGKE
jgi:alpha-galactosidase